ncbi:MAG: phage/plasmid primase, P4 family [Clostridiaceae bacterium]|nr:phage/plasmid primase, P4 family [Clostridiaceae bacterium]
MVNFTNIPADLKQSCRFCVWKREEKDGRMTKIPYNPVTGYRAQSNNPDSFSEFPQAAATYAIGGYDGIGIRVSDGIGAFDIDHCIGADGSLNEVAAGVLDAFQNCYVEKSPSGTGLRGFFRVPADYVFNRQRYYINRQQRGLEIYVPGATHRFVTVTGDVYRRGTVCDEGEALQDVLDTWMKRDAPVKAVAIEPHSYLTDEEVIHRITNSAQAEKFTKLYEGDWQGRYGSQSDADMALLSILSFWCGCDAEQMDRIYRSSALIRKKWDRKQSGSTYGALTIQKVIDHCTAIYDPVSHLVPAEDEFDILWEDGDVPLTEEAKRDLATAISLVNRKLKDMQPHTNPLYSWSEMGLGRLFADYYERIARYVPDRKSWYVYNGKVWKHDVGGMLVMQLAKHLVNELIRYAATIEGDEARTEYLEFITKTQTRRKRQIMVDDAQDEYFLTMASFDQNPLLFNCMNGTLNLKTMEFYDHSPEDFLTMLSGVTYDPEASCPRWESFVSEVMCGDAALADFFQRTLGYSLTGDVSYECMFILYGATSRNGKGTAMESFLKVMGDYGKTANPETLAAKFGLSANGGGPSEDIARLAGARFVNISEPEKRITFNAALVKRLTGNGTLSARYLHENSFEFRPAFKIFVDTNYLPNVSDMTLFESGRLKIIPFNRHFSEAEQDKTLKHLFAQPKNVSAIFNWCLEGYRRFEKDHLELPQAVKDATSEYRKESDRIGQFIAAWLEEGEAYEVRTAAVYNMYKNWCVDNGYRSENVKNFNKALGLKFELVKRRPRDGGEKTALVLGCRLRPDEDAIVEIE